MRKDNLLSREQLEQLNTKRLLAYRNRLYKAKEGMAYDDYGSPPTNQRLYVNKQDPEWQSAMATVKEILDSREHVER